MPRFIERRDLLAGGSALALAALLPSPLRAEDRYPNRTVRLVVPAPAGGAYDLIARLSMEAIGPALGTSVVENRGGGNSVIGVAAAGKSAPDGYTLLLGSNSTHIFQPAMMVTPPYDPVKDFAAVSTLGVSWACLAVHPGLPIRNMTELVEFGKKNPGKLSYGNRGIGNISHMTAELLQKLAGIKLVTVPYSVTAQALQDVMSGDLPMTVPLLTKNLIELHEAGKVRVIAITAPKRPAIAPNIPTAEEAGLSGMVAGEFFYLFAQKEVPAAILQQLNDIARRAFAAGDLPKRLTGAGFDPMFAGDLAATRATFESERTRWLPIAEATGIKI